MQILIVEDELALSNAIKKLLEQRGYFADAVYDGDSAVDYATSVNYSLIILDVMLPKRDGFEVVRALRREGVHTPILMLTARTATADKVQGLNCGADDYLTKPFDTDELLARVGALTRRTGEVLVDTVRFEDLTLELGSAKLLCGDDSVQLSRKEFDVLKTFLYNPSMTVSTETLIINAWGYDSEATDNNAEVYATAKTFDDKTMTMLDENAFLDNEVYTIVYCPDNAQDAYLDNYDINVFNKEARLPRMTRDFPTVTEEDPRIREMMNQVNMDSLQATVQHLQDYGSRIWNSDNAFAASDWIAGRMASYGLEVEQQAFNASTWMGSGAAGPNVIGIQRGTLYPDTYVVCGSHLDSFSYEAMYGGGTAPGADDNATGVASVLETVRIMSQYEFEYSIVYCAYGCEEMGLYGSEAYASRCQQQGMDIIGYFNNDMNGYLYGDEIHIDLIYPNSVEPIGTYYMNVAGTYFPEMPVRHVNFNEGDSDHTSFNNHGYMGIYPFEDYQHYSPNIHTPQDLYILVRYFY